MAGSLGDLVAYSQAPLLAPWLITALSLVGVGIYALVTGGTSNDDDDSTPGGGLMQPVA